MREGLFIKRHKERWERVQHEEEMDSDQLASEFVKLVEDLGYAKTFYPSGRVTKYLNTLSSRIYLTIYKNRKEEANRIVNFWKYDVPEAIYRNRRTLFMSFIIFALFFSIGFFSSVKEPHFVREVLGDGYVDMTEKNIREGNPFDVYKSESSFMMFVYIMVNNILVSFTYFFRGLALGIPTLFALGKESIRIGAFEYMFYAKDLGAKAVTTVLIHGLLELTAIIIACGAGVVMGTSWLFPKTKRRVEAFRDGAKDGIKMVIGLVPVFIVAAWHEGYITRHYKMPLALNILVLSFSALFVLYYFVYRPYQLRNGRALA